LISPSLPEQVHTVVDEDQKHDLISSEYTKTAAAAASHLKALKEMIKLLWREVPRQLGQQLMNILHNRLMFACLHDTTRLSAALMSANDWQRVITCYY